MARVGVSKEGGVRLSRRGRLVVSVMTMAGVVTFAAAVRSFLSAPALNGSELYLYAVLAALVAATWACPLVMYRDGQSEAQNLDEGFFVIAALLLPTGAGIMVFAVAVALAQAVRRRKLVKSIFNWGQVVTASGLGLAVTHWLAPASAKLTGPQLLAAVAGALVFAVVNGAAVTTIVATFGTPFRKALDGMEIRLLLVGSCLAVALVSSLAISEYRWALPLAVLPMVILRQVLAGHFQARHDHTRVLGLFDAALAANRSLSEGDVLETVMDAARSLLRCAEVAVRPSPEGLGEVGAKMMVNDDPAWLVVSGRSRSEPFEPADRALLEALAAVGAGALTNGRNYREARFQRQRLAAITSSLGEGVCAVDLAGEVTFINPVAAALLGVEAPGGRLAPTPPFLLDTARQVIASRETLRCDDTEFVRSDGTTLPVALTASAIVDDGQVAGAVLVFRDISERREVELAIRVARDQAIEASQLKSRFLANMSHEIRTPMNGVLGMTKLLLETGLDNDQRCYLTTIRDSGENLMVILNDILDFSKIEAGKLDLEDADFDLGAALASVANSTSVAARDKNLALHLAMDAEVPRLVRGDPVRFRQVVTNLVSNAVKFTHHGTVTLGARVPSAGRIRISVSDTGIGIEPSARATVLDAFGQADGSTTRRYGGTGLGLAICTQLVAMMGGVLDFTSQPGEGSTFWFEVPLPAAATGSASASGLGPLGAATLSAPPAGDSAPLARGACAPLVRPLSALEPRSPAAALPRMSASSAKPLVLVADDNAVNQLVASLRLEKMGYQVESVSTGADAIDAVQRTSYRAVLMDCRMPVMDGYEATRRIRALDGRAGRTFIIAMTSSAMLGDREECMVAGMDDYLAKPLDADQLAEALAHAARATAMTTDGRGRLLQNAG
ncbi:MAG: ATP-binding protein [Acidimicrobiales bacterium]